jgi:hypothetical protein
LAGASLDRNQHGQAVEDLQPGRRQPLRCLSKRRTQAHEQSGTERGFGEDKLGRDSQHFSNRPEKY